MTCCAYGGCLCLGAERALVGTSWIISYLLSVRKGCVRQQKIVHQFSYRQLFCISCMVNEIEQSVIQVCYTTSHALWSSAHDRHILVCC